MHLVPTRILVEECDVDDVRSPSGVAGVGILGGFVVGYLHANTKAGARTTGPAAEPVGRDRDGNDAMISIIIDRLHIALLSALEQTHCANVACDSE